MIKNYWIWMIIGCLLPLLLIFLAPLLGLGGDIQLFVFILIMFVCHLLMPMHGRQSPKQDSTNEHSGNVKPDRSHEQHQH